MIKLRQQDPEQARIRQRRNRAGHWYHSLSKNCVFTAFPTKTNRGTHQQKHGNSENHAPEPRMYRGKLMKENLTPDDIGKWDLVLEELKYNLNETQFDNFVRNLRIVSVDRSTGKILLSTNSRTNFST